MRRPHEIPLVAVPKDDDGYFEAMTRAVFQAGIDWDVIRQRWPAFRRAFKRFSVKRVAAFGPDDLDTLMGPESGIVRNYRKVAATLHNAAVFLSVHEEFGSFQAYIRSLDGRPYADLVRDLKGRFRYLGDTGAFVFLHGVGEEVPAWQARHVSTAPPRPRRRRV
jgi:DNA-3-methyladenine glycosylase I